MALSPNDIRNCEFSVQMRGYHKEEVDDFLEHVAAAAEAEKQAHLKLSMEIESIRTQFQALKENEDTIKDAAIDARRNADQTISQAQARADDLVMRAELESKRLLGSKEQQLREIEERVTRTREVQDSYLAQLRELIESHLEMADKISEVHHKSQATQDALEITDSSEVSRNGMETFAARPEQPDPIYTEEAKAADTIVAADTTESPEAEAESSADDQQDESEPAVDPELTAALESYQSSLNKSHDAVEQTNDPLPPVPAGQIVETTALASDVPEGFIAEAQEGDDEATGKFQVQGRQAVINDADSPDPNDSVPVDPDALAKELDKVVAKFEEEMDKAAKSE